MHGPKIVRVRLFFLVHIFKMIIVAVYSECFYYGIHMYNS